MACVSITTYTYRVNPNITIVPIFVIIQKIKLTNSKCTSCWYPHHSWLSTIAWHNIMSDIILTICHLCWATQEYCITRVNNKLCSGIIIWYQITLTNNNCCTFFWINSRCNAFSCSFQFPRIIQSTTNKVRINNSNNMRIKANFVNFYRTISI